MSFWKITSDNKPEQVSTTKLKNEQILEKHLEDWIENSTDILGEPLLIIGRQIIIPEVKERLDLLALDPSGNAVIIELKRGKCLHQWTCNHYDMRVIYQSGNFLILNIMPKVI